MNRWLPSLHWPESGELPPVLRYMIAAISALVALGLRLVLDSFLGEHSRFLMFVLAVVVARRIGGRGPGLLATAIGALAVDWFFVAPRETFSLTEPQAITGLTLFAIVGVVISLSGGRVPKAPAAAAPVASDARAEAVATTFSPRSLQQKPHLIWLSVAVLLVILESGLFWAIWTRFSERERWSMRTHTVLETVEPLFSELKDAETGQRGYLLTGKDSYLEPYRNALAQIPRRLGELRRLTAGDGGERARIENLQGIIAAKLAELDATLQLARTEGPQAAADEIRSDRGQKLMEQIRGEMGAIASDQAALLERRNRSTALMARGLIAVMVSGAGLLLLVLLTGSRAIDRNIAERNAAQRALRTSEERLQFATTAAGIGVWSWTPDTGRVVVSGDWRRLLGIAPETKVTFDTWREALHPDDRALAAEELNRAVEQRGEYNVEYRAVWPDGTVRWLADRGRASYDGAGRAVGVAGVNVDITVLKRTQAEAEAGRRTLDGYFAASPGVLNLYDPQFRYLNSDRVTPTYFGLDRRSIIGKALEELNPAVFEQTLRPIFERVTKTGKPELNVEFEAPIPNRPGETAWFRASYFPVTLPDGGVGVGSMALDVTAMKRAQDALRESESRLRVLSDNLPEGAIYRYRHDPAGEAHVDFISAGIERLTGVPAAEYMADVATVERNIFREDHERLNAAIARSRAQMARFEVEVRHKHRVTGETRWSMLRSTPLAAPDGSILWDGIELDITERKLAEEQIQRLNAELEQRVYDRTAQLEAANKELETFAYSVSHDLRAPLRGIDGWSMALLEDYGGQLDEKAHKFLDRVRSETQRMGRLIDDLLQLSRVTRGEMRAEMVDLSAIAQTVCARLKEESGGREIEFVIAPGLKSPGDARLMEIALTNLLGNAAKFTGPRERARIEFGRMVCRGKSAFFVRDNGVGFDMAFADRLFGAFQRLHKISEFAGTGIGLATVQRIIHRHGGRIWADARPGAGATFFFMMGGK